MASPDPSEPTSPLTLVVGQINQMSTRNLLPASANNVPTSAVLYRVYDTVLLSHPDTDDLLAYIVKGVDFDEDGAFEPATEYGRFAEQPGAATPLEVTLYYDFNGVRWHDGAQMTPWDLFFSYHLNAMNARFNTDLRVLFCAPTTTYESCGRRLSVSPAPKVWQGEASMLGDPNLRVAVRHTLNEPFVLFYGSTIAPVMLPMHLWSRTGGGRHLDFGCAVWIPPAEAASRSIPECGNPDPARWGTGIAATETVPGSSPYVYTNAEGWNPQDADVIGHGPFRFVSWTFGVEAVVARNEDFFTGVDAQTSTVFDASLASVLKMPTTDGIRFQPYASADLCANALNISAVDFCHANLPPAVVPDLLDNPDVAVESNAEAGFIYMGYNMRKAPFGYLMNDSANDVGYWLRQAVAHLANKTYFVNVLLEGFAVVGHGFVSPANTFWYNDAIPKPDYNFTAAYSILNSPGALAAGIGADPPGVCSWATASGCRQLPGIGNATFEILAPEMAYDPVRATAAAMIAQGMRDVGLNANATELPFATLTNRIFQVDFDMYILGWRIGGTDPDYLFYFFHSSNEAPLGQNYPGFRNATFDTVIDATRAELDRMVRRSLIFQAQSILSDARPYEVLYYRTNVEAYRQDRWVNWSVVAGSIWNYWSLIGIHPPTTFQITVDTTPPSLEVSVDGVAFTAPYSFPCLGGSDYVLSAPSPQVAGGTRYTFASWSDLGARTHTVTCTGNDTYVASFITEYEVTVDTVPSGIDVLVDGSPLVTPSTFWCVAGTTHNLEAPNPVTIPETSITFQYWSDLGPQSHTIVCGGPDTYTAYYLVVHTRWLETSPSGLDLRLDGVNVTTTPPYGFGCVEGSTYTVDAPSPQVRNGTRYAFASWSDMGAQAHPVTCQAPGTLVASFVPDAYEVTIDTSPPGLVVDADGSPHTAPYTFWCAADSTIALGVPSPQGGGTTRYAFASWSDGGSQSHAIVCTTPLTLIADFETESEVTLDTSPPGLFVTVDGTDAASPHTLWCPAGASRTLSVPSPQIAGATRSVFASWSDGGAASHAIACGGPATYTATFTREFQIAVDTAPNGLVVEVDGVVATAPHSFWCAEGASRTLSVPSPQGTGGTRHPFGSWSDGGAASHAIACGGPATFTATFATEYELTLTAVPPGLSVAVDGVPTSTPLVMWCPSGSFVAVASDSPQTHEGTRYRFVSWSDGGEQTHAVSCDAPGTFTATFDAEPPPETGAPAYLVLGGIIAVVAVALGIAYFLWRRRRRETSEEPTEPPTT